MKSARGKGMSTHASRPTPTGPQKRRESNVDGGDPSEGEEKEPPRKRQKGEGEEGGKAGGSKGSGESNAGAGGSSAGLQGASTFRRYTLAEAQAKFRVSSRYLGRN